MIHYVKGNLLDSNCNYICHQVNCQGVMGSGIAKQIRERWPEVYQSYMNVHMNYALSGWGNRSKLLGKIDIVPINSSPYQSVINMFCQDTYGYDGDRYTSYDAFVEALLKIKDTIHHNFTIGFPKNIGCGLGGGNWKVISALIEAILGEDYDVYIYELEA